MSNNIHFVCYVGSDAVEYFFMAFFYIGAFDLIVLVITGVMILLLSRHMTHSDQARFSNEAKWYLINLELSLIMLITWPFQVLSWPVEFSLLGFMTADIILLFTAITTTIILLGRKKAKNLLFEEFHVTSNTEA